MRNDNRPYTYIFLFSLLLVCCCCSPARVSNPLLLRADSIMEQHPDSALLLLRQVEQPHNMGKAEQALYALLLTQAEDKNYIEHTSDSLIRIAFDYYRKHGPTQRKMEACYYLASVYRDLGDAPLAIDYFRKAAEASKDQTEYVLLSRIYSQIGTLFFYQKLSDEGVDAYRKAYDYALLANDSLWVANSSIVMARVFTELGHVDSTLFYYNKAATIARQSGNLRLEKVAQSELAGIYLQLDKVEEARRLLDLIRKDGVDYLIWGELYEKSDQADSAWYAYSEALELGSLYVKRGASEGLYRLAKSHHQEKEALYYIEQSALYKDSIQEITDTEGVKRVESLYAYQHVTNENHHLLLANKQKEKILLWVGIALLATLLFFGYVWKRMKDQREHAVRLNHLKRQEYQKKIADYNARIDSLKLQLADSEQEKHFIKERLDKTVEEKNKMIASRQEAEAAFRSSVIYQHIQNTGKSPKVEMTEEHWLELQQEIDKTYSDFTARLYTLYPRLKQHELRVCLLIKAGVANSSIATLLCLEANSISSMRTRLFEKIHNKKGRTKDFNDFILGL